MRSTDSERKTSSVLIFPKLLEDRKIKNYSKLYIIIRAQWSLLLHVCWMYRRSFQRIALRWNTAFKASVTTIRKAALNLWLGTTAICPEIVQYMFFSQATYGTRHGPGELCIMDQKFIELFKFSPRHRWYISRDLGWIQIKISQIRWVWKWVWDSTFQSRTFLHINESDCIDKEKSLWNRARDCFIAGNGKVFEIFVVWKDVWDISCPEILGNFKILCCFENKRERERNR